MAAQARKNAPVAQTGKPPYPFRAIWALVLLAGNLLIAAIYFHVINP